MSELQPTVAVMAGINGAGKTTASNRILREFLRMPAFVNADTIARGLNAFEPESEAVKAGRIMLDHLKDLAQRRRSFSFETTLAARTYAPWLGELRASGYVVHLFYYWLRSPELAIRRVRNFLELYRPVVTTWQVYDNSNGYARLIAFTNGYFETILDQDVWDSFNRSATDGGASDAAG